jgi:transaldolase
VARTIDTEVHIAHDVWQDIQSLGIDMTAVADKLEREGVASFIKSFQELLDALSDKASTLS